ncbi:hypothetical protein ABW19_dt0206792 [Dactylella cylindrospora]|nr:hypothetical protein ABW19_dt0206792 [Dactylella cylindrospora]
MANTVSKASLLDMPRIPNGSGGPAPPPTPSRIPLPPTPTSPVSLKGQAVISPSETHERPTLKSSANVSSSSLTGVSSTHAAPNTTTATSQAVQSNGFPSLVFPPASQQAYHTRNLLLHIYSMFNGAQAAIHQLGANCEFNQNLITFLSTQIQDKDRKIQTLTASVNMLQTAVQRAMKNNDELKKAEEGLHAEIKALQSNISGSASGNRSDSEKEQELELVTKIEKLTQELESQKGQNNKLVREHNDKVTELGKEIEGLKESVAILEESLTLSVTGRFENGSWHFDDENEVNNDGRNDQNRAEKMLNGRVEDTSISDDSLIDEANSLNHTNGDHLMFTDGTSAGVYIPLAPQPTGPPTRPQYLDSIIEEPEEEESTDKTAASNGSSQPHGGDGAAVPAPRGVTRLRATAKPFVNTMEFFYYSNDENRKVAENEEEITTSFL